MTPLADEELTERAHHRTRFRVITAGTKLNKAEVATLEEHCRVRGTTPGELIRQLILRELGQTGEGMPPSPELTEVIGLRLMLMNFLKPLVTGQKLSPDMFDAIMAEIRRSKLEVAAELLQSAGGQ